MDQLKERLPEYAKDLRINLGVISSSTALTPQQAWTIALTCAVTTKQPEVIAAVEAAGQLAPEVANAARGAAVPDAPTAPTVPVGVAAVESGS